MPRHVFLLRHGQSTFNANWGSGRRDPDEIDSPLTVHGHEQVRDASERVRDLGLELVVTSPATRALQTALGVLSELSPPPIVVQPLARDRFAGDSCDYGRRPVHLQREFPTLDFTALSSHWWCTASDDHPSCPVETRDAFAVRMNALRSWLESRAEGRILVVGHEGTFRVLAGVSLANCELTEWFQREPE